MGLRSRKPGGEARKAQKEDFEQQFVENAERPLQKLHVQTEAFNLMWRGFLINISYACVAYALYAMYMRRNNIDHVGFDLLSLGFYGCSAMWIKNMEDSFADYTKDKFFRFGLIFMLSQMAFTGYQLYDKDFDIERIDREFVPLSLFFNLLVIFGLRFMRSNTDTIVESRKDLHSIKQSN